MNVKNCRKCGKLFNYIAGPPICPLCREENEHIFQDVKKYVQEHKQAGINEIAEACNVTPVQINQWVREERLVFADDSPIGIPCELCGIMIKMGKYCDKCKTNMTRNLQSAYARPSAPSVPDNNRRKPGESPRMRFLDKE